MVREAGGDLPGNGAAWTYGGFVDLAARLKAGRSLADQEARGLAVLRGLVPAPLGAFFGWIYQRDPLGASIFAAWGSSIASGFLVGPSRVEGSGPTVAARRGRAAFAAAMASPADVLSDAEAREEFGPGASPSPCVVALRDPPTSVKIERCRFLADSGGCVGMCLHLCKVPAQRYFSDIGLPLSMEPNFKDGSCAMVWGKSPPSDRALDPAFAEPCSTRECGVWRDIPAAREGAAVGGCAAAESAAS